MGCCSDEVRSRRSRPTRAALFCMPDARSAYITGRKHAYSCPYYSEINNSLRVATPAAGSFVARGRRRPSRMRQGMAGGTLMADVAWRLRPALAMRQFRRREIR